MSDPRQDPTGPDSGLRSLEFDEDGTVRPVTPPEPIPAPGADTAPKRAPDNPDDDLEIVRDLDAEISMAQMMSDVQARDRPADDDLQRIDNSPPVHEPAAGPPSPTSRPLPPARVEPDPEPEPEPEPEPGPEASPAPLPPREREQLLRGGGFVEPEPVFELPEEKPLRPPAPAAGGVPVAPVLAGVAALTVGGLALLLARAEVEPVYTWFYVFAWYPFLLAINAATALRSPRHSLFGGRMGALLAVAAWSVPAWLLFEVFNLRLQDWYYVGVPAARAERWAGILVSFATVFPGVFLLEELLHSFRLFTRARTPRFTWGDRLDRVCWALAALWTAAVLVVPHLAYPLVWGIPVLAIEPWLRRTRGPSLARDLAEGRPGRALRLLGAGMLCGLWWETANTFAGGRWIYTVPGLDPLQPFEMPALGFIGFAPFALCLWSMARALVALGLMPDWERVDGPPPAAPDALPRGARFLARLGAVAFTAVALLAMDDFTVDSTTARAHEIPHLPDGVAEYARTRNADSVRGILRLIDAGDLYVPGPSSVAEIAALEARCRLILLTGIGAENAHRLDAVGVTNVEELAARDARDLTRALAASASDGWRPHPRRVAVWVREARRAAATATAGQVSP